MSFHLICILFLLSVNFVVNAAVEDIWSNVPCDVYYIPGNCQLENESRVTVEDYERCAPAKLPLEARNYYLGRAGRGISYRGNREAYQRIRIIPKLMRDVSLNNLEISTLGQTMAVPIGMSPTAFHVLADPGGERSTAGAAARIKSVMILSSHASSRLEDVADVVRGSGAHVWMQLFLFQNLSYTIDIVRRAERSGFEALVLTVDANLFPSLSCDAKGAPLIANLPIANIPGETFSSLKVAITTLKGIRWLKSITKLPIIAKGILSGADAKLAINAGASAILVSNHGGRELDSVPATVDALPGVVMAMKSMRPPVDVYVDGGIRNGYDVYKAIARGAKMVFVGRPVLWGLAMGGVQGVTNMMNILIHEFNETMILAGASNPSKIEADTIVPIFPAYG